MRDRDTNSCIDSASPIRLNIVDESTDYVNQLQQVFYSHNQGGVSSSHVTSSANLARQEI